MKDKIDIHTDHYLVLGVPSTVDQRGIKKAYYTKSKEFHPDKGGDPVLFNKINVAYRVLTENREEYDVKSKFGTKYDETLELLEVNLEYDHVSATNRYMNFKEKEILDIYHKVSFDDFNGEIEYKRYVRCKTCKGTGKDTSTRMVIKGPDGTTKMFEADGGCDFCEGTGKDFRGNLCGFCAGNGKTGTNPCLVCSGEGRILGMQKLTGIKFEEGKTEVRMSAMGHMSAREGGPSGTLVVYHSEIV
jgi:DnaJ-class molecular chaperone